MKTNVTWLCCASLEAIMRLLLKTVFYNITLLLPLEAEFNQACGSTQRTVTHKDAKRSTVNRNSFFATRSTLEQATVLVAAKFGRVRSN